MSKTNIERILEQVEGVSEGRTKLYFVTRKEKEGIKKRDRVLDKYAFKVYQVDINDEIRKEIHSTATDCIRKLVHKKTTFAEFEVIHDGQHTLMTYPMTNKVMSFKDVVEKQLPDQPPKVKNLADVIASEELWASVIGMYTEEQKWIYAFRKILKGKVAIDPQDNPERIPITKVLHTLFNTTSQKLELVHGQTIFLDKSVDCFYFEDTFYVHKQTQFEQIIGLEEEYKQKATQVVKDLEDSGLFEGIELMTGLLKDAPMHRKLVRLKKMGLYERLDKKVLGRMQKLAKAQGFHLKIKDGKFLLENDADVDVAMKLLCAYFKQDPNFGDFYGTYAGTKLQPLKA